MIIKNTVLDICSLSVDFVMRTGLVHAVRGIGFRLKQSTRTAVLGETGCGKSVMATAVFRLLPANARLKGRILLMGHTDITALPPSQMKVMRGGAMVLLPQNPLGHLNPVYTVGFHLKESIRRAGCVNRQKLRDAALALLGGTGLKNPERVYGSYPRELSGGMAQRVVLAMGLAADPVLVVADEPTKGLDGAARDRYLHLTQSLFGKAAFLMITHDLLAAKTCERCLVMYAGAIVEDGPADTVLAKPLHPYTQGLVSSHPSKGLVPIMGEPPSMGEMFCGCSFHPRCGRKSGQCITESPPARVKDGVTVWCHHA